ncbi:MAG: hypothetical protein ABI810_17815 [Sphingomonas bacterium]
MFISLNGWPGAGKLSVGLALAELLDARLLDNHSWMNVAIALTEFGSAAYYEAARAVRDVAFGVVLALPPEVPIIFTNVNATGGTSGFAEEHWNAIRALAAKRKVPVISVMVDCHPDERARRIVSPERRLAKKLRDPEVLHRMMARRSLFDDGADYRHTVDTTHISPENCAGEIAAWIRVNVALS